MPLYEYVCEKCGQLTESLEDEGTNEIVCPECSGKANKVLSKANWSFHVASTMPIPPEDDISKKEKKKIEEKEKSDRPRLLDFECDNEDCKFVDEYFVRNSEMSSLKCPKCGSSMHMLFPTNTTYKLLYDPKIDRVDWSGNTTHYWDAVKAERAKGKSVKGLHEE